jgi:hypothetical protein
MPRKPKTNKRLDKLFKDINPEENVSDAKSKPKVRKEAPQADPKPVSAPQAASTPVKTTARRHTSALVMPEHIPPLQNNDAGSVYSTSLQIGDADWATLRMVDESQTRKWSPDEQLLIKEVTDQLSLALENARLFQETQKRAQELSIINQVVLSASGSLDLQSILQSKSDVC